MPYQIVIPMSGFGERFRRAGYTVPKPLIPVDGKPVIAHVLDMFPGEKNIYFICNSDHLEEKSFHMREQLKEICPYGKIISISPHKMGPVYAVSKILDHLNNNFKTIITYCDFTCIWNWNSFKTYVESTKCDGAVVCYRGFHPHMLYCTKYAYVKTDADKVISIQEKQSYTNTPMNECASSGIYYFREPDLLRTAIKDTLRRTDLMLHGEYYVSLAYRPLLEQGRDIRVFMLEKFFQWGTPEDLEDWRYHARALRAWHIPQKRPEISGTLLIPAAGLGSRFSEQNYSQPKPLIPVAGRSMILQAWEDLPRCPQTTFVIRKDMPGKKELLSILKRNVAGSDVIVLSEKTDGEARTCLLAMQHIDPGAPLTIAACDNGLRYSETDFMQLWSDTDVDVIVWTARGFPGARRRPEMYGWVKTDDTGTVRDVSVKTPLENPATDPIITGTFSFKKAEYFIRSAQHIIERNEAVQGEFYVDSCINASLALGLRIKIFDVKNYLCWGTPEDLKTFLYWHEVFK